MKDMNARKPSQKLIDAYRIHYNFIREHRSMNQTPAEASGIKPDLGENKIESLIKLASKPRELTPRTFRGGTQNS